MDRWRGGWVHGSMDGFNNGSMKGVWGHVRLRGRYNYFRTAADRWFLKT